MKRIGTIGRWARRVGFALLFAGGFGPVRGEILHTVPRDPVYYAPIELQRDLDLDGDGVVDYTIICGGGQSVLQPHGSNTFISVPEPPPDFGSFLAALDPGALVSSQPSSIDPSYQWFDASTDPVGYALIATIMDIGTLGNFFGGRHYIGIAFTSGGRTHYGWIGVESEDAMAGGQFTDWAYETRADTPILIGASGGAPPLESVGLPDRFVCTLAVSTSNTVLFVGAGGFLVDCNQLRFVLNVADPFTNVEAAMLTTPSRQVRVDLGAGQPVEVSLFAPVQVPGEGTSAATPGDLDFLYPAHQYSGLVPLTETLLREIQAGQAALTLYLPDAASNPVELHQLYQPDLVAGGSLLALPQPGATNPAPCWPRAPRSTTVRYTPGPAVGFPWVSFGTATVDLDGEGQPDFNLGGNALCTASIPACCTTWFEATGVSSNELLVVGQDLAVVELGTSLGPEPQSGAAWSSAGGFLTETGSGCGYRPWSGELGRRGEGYLGTRLRLADGDHYGWMRVVLAGSALSPAPGFMFLGPVVVDWAFELQPGVATVAGARPSPAAMASLGIVRPGYLRTRVATEPGWSYAVQQRSSITQGNWQSAGFTFVGDGSETLLDLPMTGAAGFFRVVEAE